MFYTYGITAPALPNLNCNVFLISFIVDAIMEPALAYIFANASWKIWVLLYNAGLSKGILLNSCFILESHHEEPMPCPSAGLFYFPTTVCVIDDDAEWMHAIASQLDTSSAYYRFFSSPYRFLESVHHDEGNDVLRALNVLH